MPRIGPVRRKHFISYLQQMGFDGRDAGGKHQIMRKGLGEVIARLQIWFAGRGELIEIFQRI